MKRTTFFTVILCLIAIVAQAARQPVTKERDLSALNLQRWPTSVAKPPLKATMAPSKESAREGEAAHQLIPLGGMNWMGYATKKADVGTNSQPEPGVAVLKRETPYYKYWVTKRADKCGNTAGGSWVEDKPQPHPVASETRMSVSCRAEARPTTSTTTTTSTTSAAPVTLSAMGYQPPAQPTVTTRETQYTVGAWWNSAQAAQQVCKPKPPPTPPVCVVPPGFPSWPDSSRSQMLTN